MVALYSLLLVLLFACVSSGNIVANASWVVNTECEAYSRKVTSSTIEDSTFYVFCGSAVLYKWRVGGIAPMWTWTSPKQSAESVMSSIIEIDADFIVIGGRSEKYRDHTRQDSIAWTAMLNSTSGRQLWVSIADPIVHEPEVKDIPLGLGPDGRWLVVAHDSFSGVYVRWLDLKTGSQLAFARLGNDDADINPTSNMVLSADGKFTYFITIDSVLYNTTLYAFDVSRPTNAKIIEPVWNMIFNRGIYCYTSVLAVPKDVGILTGGDVIASHCDDWQHGFTKLISRNGTVLWNAKVWSHRDPPHDHSDVILVKDPDMFASIDYVTGKITVLSNIHFNEFVTIPKLLGEVYAIMDADSDEVMVWRFNWGMLTKVVWGLKVITNLGSDMADVYVCKSSGDALPIVLVTQSKSITAIYQHVN